MMIKSNRNESPIWSNYNNPLRRRLLGPCEVLGNVLLVLGSMNLLLDLREADVRNGVVAIEDARNLLERGTLGLGIDEIDKYKLGGVPELIWS